MNKRYQILENTESLNMVDMENEISLLELELTMFKDDKIDYS